MTTFSNPRYFSSAPGRNVGFGIGPINNTAGGRDDLVIGTADRVLNVVSFEEFPPVSVETIQVPGSGTLTGLSVGDINGDRLADVLTITNDNGRSSFQITFNNNGTLGGLTTLPSVSGSTLIGAIAKPIKNVFEKGFVVYTEDRISVFRISDRNTFLEVNATPFKDRKLQFLTDADVNGDGFTDLVGIIENDGAEGGLVSFINQNDPLQPAFRVGTRQITPAKFNKIATGDFNKDGKVDLVGVTHNPGSTKAFYLQGRGDGLFTPTEVELKGAKDVKVADINNDSKLDVISLLPNSSEVVVNFGNGDGTFKSDPLLIKFPEFRPNDLIGLEVGYVNGDKLIDIAVLGGNGRNAIVFGQDSPPPPPNTPPVAANDNFTAFKNADNNNVAPRSLTLTTEQLLKNDSDANSDPLTITKVTAIANGTVTLNPDKTILFTPTLNFTGQARFSYEVSDGKGGTGVGTVFVDVGDVLIGGRGAQEINGTPGNDVIRGRRGRDTLRGDGGDDFIFGGPGRDTLFGGKGNDTLVGGLGGDRLFGEDGNDTLRAGRGGDWLYGGQGDDTLRGGAGKDTFVLNKGDSGKDTILDFRNRDTIGLGGGLKFSDLTFSGNDILFGGQAIATLVGVNTSTLGSNRFEIVSV